MRIEAFDHIVLCVADVPTTCAFYADLLGMAPREERPGKWSLYFGANKISLQSTDAVPAIARGTTPGSGNFCLITAMPIVQVVARLKAAGVAILEGPGERLGATGPILSVYFHDPDGNLVEVSNRL